MILFLCGISHTLSAPAIFIYLCTRGKRLSRGFYLARFSTCNREDVFVPRPLVDYPYQLLPFGEF